MVSNEFAKRYGSEGIINISLHPGTSLCVHSRPLFLMLYVHDRYY